MKRNRRGFTVWESLIAIGVVAIVLAIALPVAQKAYQSAQTMDFGIKLEKAEIMLELYSHYLSNTVDYTHVEEMIGSKNDGFEVSGDCPQQW